MSDDELLATLAVKVARLQEKLDAAVARADAAEAVIAEAARILPSNVADAYDILSAVPQTVLAERDRNAEQCEYSGLGVYDKGDLPNAAEFEARCTCGRIVTVQHGRIPRHDKPVAPAVSHPEPTDEANRSEIPNSSAGTR